MKSSRFEQNKKAGNDMMQDIKNLFRLKKEINDTSVKNTRKLFRKL